MAQKGKESSHCGCPLACRLVPIGQLLLLVRNRSFREKEISICGELSSPSFQISAGTKGKGGHTQEQCRKKPPNMLAYRRRRQDQEACVTFALFSQAAANTVSTHFLNTDILSK